MEIRVGQVKAASPGRLVGHAAVFNSEANLGEFIEIIRPGAFSESLKQLKKIQALYAHDMRSLLGTTPKTLKLSEDSEGLAFDLQLPDTSIGRDVSVLVDRGDVEGCSFAFDAIEDRWTKRPDGTLLRELIRVNLHEITITANPAYPDTTVAKRSAIDAGVMPLIADLNRLWIETI